MSINITEDFLFSSAFINSVWAIAAVCLIAPLLLYIFNAFRKRMSHVALAAGLVAFILLGYLLSGIVLGGLKQGFLSALYYTAIEVAGAYAIMRWLAKKNPTPGVPIGYAIGYSAIPMIIFKGVSALVKLSVANSYNKLGYADFLKNYDGTDLNVALITLNEYAAETLEYHLLIAAEYLLGFALTVGTVRLIWYSIHGDRRQPSWLFLVAAMLLRFAAEYCYQAEYSIVTQCTYYALAAITFIASLVAAKLWDNPETYTQRVSRKHL